VPQHSTTIKTVSLTAFLLLPSNNASM
jgi:hypothetical protein